MQQSSSSELCQMPYFQTTTQHAVRTPRRFALGITIVAAILLTAGTNCYPQGHSSGQRVLLSDRFATDTSLNSALWTTDTPLLRSMAGSVSFFFTSAWVEPNLSFSAPGMTMSGVTGNYQFTGIQSVNSFVPPFTVWATVTGNVANGNPFEFHLISGDLRQHLSVVGNVGKRNVGYYGMWLSCNGPVMDLFTHVNLYPNPDINVLYTVTIIVGASGTASINLTDSRGKVLGSRTGMNLGTDPFFLVLAQYEGAPSSGPGLNSATWASVELGGAGSSVVNSPAPSGGPKITSVSPILPQPNQTITITGHGLGTLAAYNGDSDYIQIDDLTHPWTAGHTSEPVWNGVTLRVSSWANSQIVLAGFTGRYGMAGTNFTLQAGDQVLVQVWNAQTRAGPAIYYTKVAGGPGPGTDKTKVQGRALALGAWLGSWPTASAATSFQNDSDERHLDIINIFTNWSQSFSDLQSTLSVIEGIGSLPMITWQPCLQGSSESTCHGFCDSQILSGTHDAYIRAFARGVAGLQSPVLIRPMHEMNGNWYAWALGFRGCGNTGKQFKDAWRHIVEIFREESAQNAKFVWCPNNTSSLGVSMSDAYPGDEYVDYAGIDGYNWGNTCINCEHPLGYWQSFEQVFGSAYKAVTSISSRPVLISEWASANSGGSKSDWIENAFEELQQSAFCRVVGAIWFNEDKERDWRIESSPSSQAAYGRLASMSREAQFPYAANCASTPSGGSMPFSTPVTSPPSQTITPGGISISPAPQRPAASGIQSDRAIVSGINGKLWQDAVLKTLDIRVSAQKGVVTLTGTVNTELEKAAVEHIAAAEAGVQSVVNHLMVSTVTQ
jgi:mannan endo-1,4-beta-mannosidase